MGKLPIGKPKRQAVVLPINKFEGWLISIPMSARFRSNNPELAARLDKFQADGMKALHEFMNHGIAVRDVHTGEVADSSNPRALLQALFVQMDRALEEQDRKIDNQEIRIRALESRENMSGAMVPIMPLGLPAPEPVGDIPLRPVIHEVIVRIAKETDDTPKAVYDKVYCRLNLRHGIKLYRRKRARNQTTLDVVEKAGYLKKMWSEVCILAKEKNLEFEL